MVAGTLYAFPESHRALRARVVAALSGAELNYVELATNDTTHPHVPLFESQDKKVRLFEANSIAYYLASEQLRGGASQEARAQVIQWVNFGSLDLASAVASWVFPSLSLVESTPQNVQRAQSDLRKLFHCLDEHLKTRTYLVGERLSLADVSVAADLLLAYQHVADEAFRKPYTNLNRWFTTVVNQTHFRRLNGEVKFCVKALEFDAKKFAQVRQQAKPAKQETAKPAAAPKPAAPAPKKKEVEPEEEEDDILAQEPKQTDPFATMPKGNFNMDEFKRTYSNNDTATVALPYFWKNFEKEFYSIWLCDYKYPQDFTKTFMTGNLIGGMYQRIEKLRKNAFASMCVWGVDNDNTIAGVWFWKGQELVFPLCSDWTTDYESYNWRKMNPDDENDRKLVEQFWSWEGEYQGKKFCEGKIFK